MKGDSDTKWTIETYSKYNEGLRELETKFQAERDRRYTEINIEKEKALKIKETADLAALELARESQKYKEERNDAVREQSLGDRGAYATHQDVAMVVERMEKALRPLVEFVNSQQGAEKGSSLTTGRLVTTITTISTIIGIIVLLASKLLG